MAYGIRNAVAEVRRWIQRKAAGPAEAVSATWAAVRKRLSAKDLDVLAREGLQCRVHYLMHEERDAGPQIVGVMVQRPGNPCPETVLVSVSYMVEAGEVKVIRDITVADGRFIATSLRQKADGMNRRAAWFDAACEMMLANGAARIGDLPEALRKELEAKWPE